MDLIPQKISNISKRKGLLIPLALAVILLLAVLSQSIYSILSYDNIYSGVYINGIHVGTLSTEEAKILMRQRVQDIYPNSIIQLKCNGVSQEFAIKDLQVNYMLDRAINNAYLVGREGSFASRIATIINSKRYGKIISFPFTYNQKILNTIIDSIYNDVFRPVKEYDLTVDDKNIVITSGKSGFSFDRTQLLSEIERHIASGTNAIINIPVITTKPSIVTVDELYSKVFSLPKDAYYTLEDGNLVIIPHTVGRDIDKNLASEILDSVQKQEGSISTLPLVVEMPNVLKEDLEQNIFRDELHSASTTFNAGNINRSHNIRLASDKINGTVLLPGEIFSYNDVVGPRTTELGYKAAAAYLNGRVVDSTGGGICQVSSTLYNAVLFSDLEVVERVNHHFSVGYVLLGHDATVAYDLVDFKFKNSTLWPIKIISTVSGGKITVSLMGTNEDPGKVVQTRVDLKRTINFTENIQYDDTMPEGSRKITTSGMNGYVADLYKIIKKDGVVIDEYLVSKNHYYPLTQQVVVGTKKAPVSDDSILESSDTASSEDDAAQNGHAHENIPEIPYNFDDTYN